MRTTVTLDAEVAALVKRVMRERGITFKQAINDAIRAGMRSDRPDRPALDFPTYDMGEPLIDLTKAHQVAGELEDREILARMKRGA